VLLLELALCLLPSRVLALKGSLSLLEGRPLLLELGFCLLTCAPLLANCSSTRGERGDLLLQVGI
jgi:hypothetical protein